MPQPRWEHFEHQADIGIRGYGTDPATAFEQAALALTGIVTGLELVKDSEMTEITCEETELELLFVDWLNALIYQMAIKKMLFSRFKINISNGILTALAWGENVDITRHQPAVEIKGATYTELGVFQTENEWVAQCVVDV
ncbi:MAG: archease [Gammaproteobacteria bacterium]|nr:archease [Gammaproteobacteria bacterium]